MFSWLLVILAVLAIFNAEKLPAWKKLAEDKFKDSVVAAKEGSKIAKDKVKKVKEEIERKKDAAQASETEENTPEEIAESMTFMDAFVEAEEQKKVANGKKSLKKPMNK